MRLDRTQARALLERWGSVEQTIEQLDAEKRAAKNAGVSTGVWDKRINAELDFEAKMNAWQAAHLNQLERDILHLRYVRCKGWHSVGAALYYHPDRIKHLHAGIVTKLIKTWSGG